MTVGSIDNPVKGGIPKDGRWGPQIERDKIAQAVLDVLPKPDFFICFYHKEDDAKRIQLLVHGAAQMKVLYQIQDALDDLISETESRIERAHKEQGKVV